MLANDLVHQRLCYRGFVRFVMAATAIADKINHHVFVKFSTIVNRQLCDEQHRFWVVCIDVEYRRLNHFRNVGTILC